MTPFLLLSGFLSLAATAFLSSEFGVWILAASQLVLLLGHIRKGQVSGVGAFIFMSFLFFSIRPIYMISEKDYFLFSWLFRIRAEMPDIIGAMWWATLALWCFAFGAEVASRASRAWLQRRKARALLASKQVLVSAKICYAMMIAQLLTLPAMLALASAGRNLYGSAFGAYAYDLPVPLQAVHIITIVVLLERCMRNRTPASIAMLCASTVLFLGFTWLMRDVTSFRGFYIAGLMIVGIAALQRIKGRVGYFWLIVPILALQPFFQYLGQVRVANNERLAQNEVLEGVLKNRTLSESYWKFYESRGDMNIFDTFVAAKGANPTWYPYIWSWAYVPLHIVPRAIWSEKPKRGITQDLSFLRGAPYSPGIAGFFLMDGGIWWMLLSMFVLGCFVSLLDGWVFTLPRGYLQYCLIGIVTINAMFLTRFFLWQYFYQVLYAVVPCLILAWWFGRNTRLGSTAARNQKRSMGTARV